MKTQNSNHIETLNPRHFRILDLCLQGKTAKQTSDILQMSYNQVMNIMHSPNFQHELSLRRVKIEDKMDTNIADAKDTVNDVLKQAALNAANNLINGLNSKDDSIVFRSATDILDRTGYPKVTKNLGGTVAAIVISKDDAERIAESMDLDKNVKKVEENDKVENDKVEKAGRLKS